MICIVVYSVGQSVTIQAAFHQTFLGLSVDLVYSQYTVFLDNVILAGYSTKEAGVLVLHVSSSGNHQSRSFLLSICIIQRTSLLISFSYLFHRFC